MENRKLHTNMASDANTVRRSNRLRNKEPEFPGLDGPERTPTKHNSPTQKTDLKRLKHKRDRSSSSSSSDHQESNGKTVQKLLHKYEPTAAGRQISNQKVRQNFNQKTRPERSERWGEIECAHASSALLGHSNHSNTLKLNSILKFLIGGILVVIVFIVLVLPSGPNLRGTDHLKSLFPQQTEKLWGFVSHGMNDDAPFVLLLLHDSQDDLAQSLAKHVAETVASNRVGDNVTPIILDGKSISPDLLVTLRPEMEKKKALVLHHLEELPGNKAGPFHFILDVHEPWIPSGVYAITLNVPKINNKSGKEASMAVQTFLKNKWSGQIKEDDLNALITRICHFDYVLRVDDNIPDRNTHSGSVKLQETND